MSDRTQAQGRSFYTERDFAFTPAPNTDLYRTSLRWLIDLQRQLYVGSGCFDPVAKAAAMARVPEVLKTFTVTPATVIPTITTGIWNDVEVATASVVGYTLVPVIALPAGLTLVTIGKSIRIQGKPTAQAVINTDVVFSKQNYSPVTAKVKANVMPPIVAPEDPPVPEPEPEQEV